MHEFGNRWQNLVMLTRLSYFHLWKFDKHDSRKNWCPKDNLCGTGSHIELANWYIGLDLIASVFPPIALPHFPDDKQNTYGLHNKQSISKNQSASKNPTD